MCGIFCSLSKSHHILPDKDIVERLQARGPDSVGKVSTIHQADSTQERDTPNDNVYLTFCSTVLSLRGSQTIIQPYQGNDKKFTLCWNGEAWSVDGERPSGNDTEAVYKLLAGALQSPSNYETPETTVESGGKVANALSRSTGPYAFVLFDHSQGRIFLARDFLGRRSLLKRITESGDLIISSVSDGNAADGWTEIEPDGIYCLNLHKTDECIVRHGSQFQIWGNFVAELVQYNFAHDSEDDTGSIPSVGHQRASLMSIILIAR